MADRAATARAPVRIGILGCARIAPHGIIEPAAELPDLEIAAVAARDHSRAERFAARYGIRRCHRDYAALVDDPDLDAIYNPLPNSLHHEWSRRALQAGKAVLCEKPITANAEQARDLAAVARAVGRPLVEAFHYRYHPLALEITRLVSEGAIGGLVSVEARFSIPGDRLPPDDIRFRYALAGGATMDLGSYCVNVLRLLTGSEPAVRSAVATLRPPDIDEAMNAELHFPSGVSGRIICSLAHESFDAWLSVVGEDGELAVRNPFHPQRGHAAELRRGGEVEHLQFDPTPTFVYQAREFAAAVAHGGPIRTGIEDGIANMAVIDDIYRAAGMHPRGN